MFELILLLTLIIADTYASTVNYATPPAISSSILFDLPSSSENIFSKYMENMAITKFTLNSSPYTNISLGVLDASDASRKRTYLLTLTGEWTHVESSSESLDCSVIYEINTKVLGLIYFNRSSFNFGMLGQIPLSYFSNDAVTLDLMRQVIMVSEGCQVIVYTNPYTNETTFYRASADWSTIHAITNPPNWKPQAFSQNLLFAISDDKIYWYNSSSYQIQLLYTFHQKYDRYVIKNKQDKILVSAALTSPFSSGSATNVTNYTIFAFAFGKILAFCGEFTANGLIQSTEIYSIITSPLLSKVALGYYDQQKNFKLILKRVFYNRVSGIPVFQDINFKQLPRFAQTVNGIDINRELFLGENYVVVRNGSRFNASVSNSNVVEEAYQFVGNQLVFLRNRTLVPNNNLTEVQTFSRISIYSFGIYSRAFNSDLLVLNLYKTNQSRSYVEQLNYGNIATVRKIQSDPVSPFISFGQPSGNSYYLKNGKSLVWSFYQYTSSTNITNFTIIASLDSTSAISNTTFSKQGSWGVNYTKDNCLIIGSNITYRLYRFNKVTSTFEDVLDLTPHLSAIQINSNVSWTTSYDCSRVRVNSILLVRSSTGNYISVTPRANFNVTAGDQNLTVLMASDSTLWSFDPSVNNYIQIFTSSTPFPLNSKIRGWMDRILIWSLNSTKVQLMGLTVKDKQATMGLNYSITKYTFVPNLHISSDLSKVLMQGTRNDGGNFTYYLDLFMLDYEKKQVSNYTFPSSMSDKVLTTNRQFAINSLFLYVSYYKSMVMFSNGAVTQSYNGGQYIYQFQENGLPKLISEKSVQLNYFPNQVIRGASIVQNYLGSFLLTEYIDSSFNPRRRIVKSLYLGGKPSSSNDQSQSVSVQVQNGLIKVCPVGCSNCSCSSCLPGYVLNPLSSASCLPCGISCIACNPNNISQCQSCMVGTFLNSTNQCEPCASECLSCNVSASQCLACKPGFYYNTSLSICQACIKDCFICSSSDTCVTCFKGFALVGTNMCRACASVCSECDPSNITKCTGCGRGLRLLNGVCTTCPTNCLSCSSSACTLCADGYTIDNSGNCVTKCLFPCLSCYDKDPTNCTQCPKGSLLKNGKCQFDIRCNANESCTDCSQGFNYLLIPTISGAYCSLCPNISNCLQCDASNAYSCVLCKDAFYPSSDGTCTACSANCTTCKSSAVCTGCSPGFTLAEGFTQGSCLKCQAPCLTCVGSATFCTSCNRSTHIRVNSQCRNNIRIGFKFVVKESPENILNNIDMITLGLLQMLKEPSNNTAAIMFDQISAGSTVVSGAASPSSSSVSTASSLLSEGLKSGIPNTNYTVTSSSVVVQNSAENSGSSDNNNSDNNQPLQNSSSSNKAILLGVLIPVGVLIIIGVAIFVYYKRKQETPTSFQEAPIGSSATLPTEKPEGSAKGLANPDFTLFEEKGKR